MIKPYWEKAKEVESKKRLAVSLRKKGYSIRQIMVKMKYKSPQSIQRLVRGIKYKT